MDGLYLGGIAAADDAAYLRALGISHLLSLGEKPDRVPNSEVHQKFIDIDDVPDADLLSILDDAVQYV